MPGVSSIVNSSICLLDSTIAAFALSASALIVNSIFALPSFSWNASSSGVLTGFDVCTIAPSRMTAKNTIGHSGTFGDHSDTTSPFLMPRAASPAAVLADLLEQLSRR